MATTKAPPPQQAVFTDLPEEALDNIARLLIEGEDGKIDFKEQQQMKQALEALHDHVAGPGRLDEVNAALAAHAALAQHAFTVSGPRDPFDHGATWENRLVTPLGYAANIGDPNLMRLFLKAGADPRAAGEHLSPMALALEPATALRTRLGREACALMLVEAGANVHELLSDGLTALHHAVKQNNAALVEKLLDAGADPTTCAVNKRGDHRIAAALVHTCTNMLAERRKDSAAFEHLARRAQLLPLELVELVHMVTLALKAGDEKRWFCIVACCPHVARALYEPEDPADDSLMLMVCSVLEHLLPGFPGAGGESGEAVAEAVVAVMEAFWWRVSRSSRSPPEDEARAGAVVSAWVRAFTEHNCWLSHGLRAMLLSAATLKEHDRLAGLLAADPGVARSVASHRALHRLCANQACGAPLLRHVKPHFRCTGCYAAKYCGEDCQTADWPFHKVFCRHTEAHAAYRLCSPRFLN